VHRASTWRRCGPSSLLHRRCNCRWCPSDRLRCRDSIPRCGPSSLLRRSIPQWCTSFHLRSSPAMPRCGHSGRSPWQRWSVGATEGRWGIEGRWGTEGVEGLPVGRYIDITGRPILIRYNRPIYKKCAAADNCNH
jgi:hypothetical protein